MTDADSPDAFPGLSDDFKARAENIRAIVEQTPPEDWGKLREDKAFMEETNAVFHEYVDWLKALYGQIGGNQEVTEGQITARIIPLSDDPAVIERLKQARAQYRGEDIPVVVETDPETIAYMREHCDPGYVGYCEFTMSVPSSYKPTSLRIDLKKFHYLLPRRRRNTCTRLVQAKRKRLKLDHDGKMPGFGRRESYKAAMHRLGLRRDSSKIFVSRRALRREARRTKYARRAMRREAEAKRREFWEMVKKAMANSDRHLVSPARDEDLFIHQPIHLSPTWGELTPRNFASPWWPEIERRAGFGHTEEQGDNTALPKADLDEH